MRGIGMIVQQESLPHGVPGLRSGASGLSQHCCCVMKSPACMASSSTGRQAPSSSMSSSLHAPSASPQTH